MTLPKCKWDLWEYLSVTRKRIVLYGMGNGADKILSVCAERGIKVHGVFASDGFARGNLFHGMPVQTWHEMRAEHGAENLIVLLAFGSSREDVLETILRVAGETELYAPDVPAFGDGLFDRSFFEAHLEELAEARALLSDTESRRIFDNVLQYKLSGNIRFLLNAESDMEAVWRDIVCPEGIRTAVDAGAYNGDTVCELIERGNGTVERIYALEPDARSYKRLTAYAAGEKRCEVVPLAVGAWSEKAVLHFDKSGNRNASVEVNRSHTLSDRPVRLTEIFAEPIDEILNGVNADYIKYDVEGSEREALIGSRQTIARCHPTLLVSLYHRNEDLFALPLQLHALAPQYDRYYLRRSRGVPAWDVNLYVKKIN